MTDGLSDEELAFLQSAFGLARDGAAAELDELLAAGLPVNLTNSAGDSLLLLAAYHKQPETVRVLLARGADTARVNDRGQTALGAAVFRQSGEIVTALLDAGADPELGPRSALEVAAVFELPEMLAMLRRA